MTQRVKKGFNPRQTPLASNTPSAGAAGAGVERHIAEVQANASGPSFHIHPFDQFYYVIGGRLNVEVGLRKYQADANSLVILPAGVVHQNHNAGPGVEKHITILVPHPAPGEPLDIPVHLQHDKAFGRLEPSAEEAP